MIAGIRSRGAVAQAYAPVAAADPETHRESRLYRSDGAQQSLGDLLDTLRLPEGAEMLTEISVKFRLPELQDELRGHGLDLVESWTDREEDYSLTLAVKR